MLRAVMHGYYINTATYNKVKQMANPVKPQNVIKEKLKEKLATQNTIKLKHDMVSYDYHKLALYCIIFEILLIPLFSYMS